MSTRLEKAGQTYRNALAKTKSQSSSMKNSAGKIAQQSVEKSRKAYAAAKTRANDTAEQAVIHVDENPLRYIAAGAFLGAVAGAFIPKLRGEDAALDSAERFLSDAVQKIADGAVDAFAPKD